MIRWIQLFFLDKKIRRVKKLLGYYDKENQHLELFTREEIKLHDEYARLLSRRASLKKP